METQKDVKMSGGSGLDTANGKASGDNAAAAKIANCAGGMPSAQAALEVGSMKTEDPYGKK